jgi:hypothetical protein
LRRPPQENWSFDSGGRRIVFEFATALRCFAERYMPLGTLTYEPLDLHCNPA